jgi:hypothetical protein
MSIDSAIDLLEMSMKYMVDFIFNMSITFLRYVFPCSLTGYQKSREHRNGITPDQLLRCITVATAHNFSSLLPAAYFTLCTMFEIEELLNPNGRFIADSRPPMNVVLNVSLGSRRLLKLKRDVVDAFIQEFVSGIVGYHCEEQLRHAFLAYHVLPNSYKSETYDEHLDFSTDLFSADLAPWADEVCPECIRVWVKREQAGREDAWRRLPSCFGLKSWDELHGCEPSL